MRSYYRYVPQNRYPKKVLDEIDRQGIQRVADAVAGKRRLELIWLIGLLLLTLLFIVPITDIMMRTSLYSGLLFLGIFMFFPLGIVFLAIKGKKDSTVVWEESNIAYGTIISERSEMRCTREPLNKSRLTAQHLSRLHLFRHLAPNSLENRQVYSAHLIQSDEKSDSAI